MTVVELNENNSIDYQLIKNIMKEVLPKGLTSFFSLHQKDKNESSDQLTN